LRLVGRRCWWQCHFLFWQRSTAALPEQIRRNRVAVGARLQARAELHHQLSSEAKLVEQFRPLLACGMDFTITQITPAEVPELLKLIRELARFERLEHELKATVASLRKALFGPQPVAGALLARCEGKAVGYAIYFSTFSSFVGRPGLWLEDLYVRPKFRQRGVGRRLIEAVAGVAATRNCGRFEWTALNWNRNALEFYKRLGAKALNEWVLVRLDSRGLRRLAATGKERIQTAV